uniref:G-protein coupled receptors family 1 profile domain-containing protein n=1 Tax=Latimeria chalumnae TaxID=7897 RepID=H2ZV47_LATCH
SSNSSFCVLQPDATKVIIPVIYCILFVIGVLGNSISMWIFTRKITAKKSTHIYLINLIFSNLLMCSVMPLQSAYFLMGHQWTTTSLICIIIMCFVVPVFHANNYVNLITLSSIAISRYAILVKHNESTGETNSFVCSRIICDNVLKKFRDGKFAKRFSVAMWIIVVCTTLPLFLLYAFKENKKQDETVCFNERFELRAKLSHTATIFATVFFLLCFLMVLVSYICVAKHVYKSQAHTSIKQNHLVYRKVLRNILFIQIVLSICFLPYHIFRPILITITQNKNCSTLNHLVEVKNLLFCLEALRSSTDPFIYLTLDRTFQKHVHNLMRKVRSSFRSEMS